MTQAAINTSTGNQDITVPGLGWTPKAAIITATLATANNTIGAENAMSFGAAAGANQWCVAISERDGLGATNTHARRSASPSSIVKIMTSSGTPVVNAEAAFVSFLSDGIRVNVTTASNAYLLNVVLLGGDSLTAAAGVQTLAAASNSVTVTPGFQTEALVVGNPNDPFTNTEDFDGSIDDEAFWGLGLASYDGTTIRQASQFFYANHGALRGEANTRVESDSVICHWQGPQKVTLENITSTSFDLTSDATDYSSSNVGWLALNLSGANVWAGMIDSPTTTGNDDETSPGFQPLLGMYVLSEAQAVASDLTDATASTAGFCAFDANNAGSACGESEDNSDPTDTDHVTDNVAVHSLANGGTTAYRATFNQFLPTGVRLNYATAQTPARKWPALFIGSP